MRQQLAKKNLYRSIAELDAKDIKITNFEDETVTRAISRELISAGLALQLDNHHIPVLVRFPELIKASLREDPTGKVFLTKLQQYHIATLEHNPSYYQAIINGSLAANVFLKERKTNFDTYTPRL